MRESMKSKKRRYKKQINEVEFLPEELCWEFTNTEENTENVGVAIVNMGGVGLGAYIYTPKSMKENKCLQLSEDLLKNDDIVNKLIKQGILLNLSTVFNYELAQLTPIERVHPFILNMHLVEKNEELHVQSVLFGDKDNGRLLTEEEKAKLAEGLNLKTI